MTINEIQPVILTDEHRTLELKKTTGELKDGMHTACAFLNTDGGWLIFGVSPTSLKVTGQEVTDNTQQEIAKGIAGLQPAVNAIVHYIPLDGRAEEDVSPNSANATDKRLIAIYFQPFRSGSRPFTFHGRPYYKVESITKEMPRDMFDELLRQSNPQFFAWEKQPAEGFRVQDLNESRIRGALHLGENSGRILPGAASEPLDTLLARLQLLSDGQPNNAAAMLFGRKTADFPQFKIRMARFHGTSKSQFDDLQMAEGNFFDLLDAGMAFLVKHLPISAKIAGFRREEQLEIPAAALREALINSLCHRQWERYNLSIGLAIYDDRIEIENPGILPPQITPDSIKLPHLSYPYNTIIADVLYKTTYLEQWGSGAQRIIDACRQQQVAEPTWNSQAGFVTITFPRPTSRQSESVQVSKCPSVQVNTDDDRFRLILDYCMMPRSRKEILLHIGLINHSKHYRHYIKPLLDSGQLSMTKPETPNSPLQKYITACERASKLARVK